MLAHNINADIFGMKLAGLIVVISSSYVNSNPRPIWHTGIKGALVSFAQKYAFCWLLTLKKVSFSCIDSHFIYELGKRSWIMISWFVAKKISGPLAHLDTHIITSALKGTNR